MFPFVSLIKSNNKISLQKLLESYFISRSSPFMIVLFCIPRNVIGGEHADKRRG